MRNYLNKILSPLVILAFLLNPLGVMGASNTFGHFDATDTGSSSNSSAEVVVSNYTTGTNSGTLTSGQARVRVTSGSGASTMVVYSDVAGTPTTLLATSDEVTVTETSLTTKTYTFSNQNKINLTQNTTYWVGIHHADPGSPSFVLGTWDDADATNFYKANFSDTYPGAETTFAVDDSFTFFAINLEAYYQSPEGISYPLINPNLNDSGLRLNLDGVDERLTSASNPSFSTDTKSGGRTLCEWVNLDTLPASEANFGLFGWSGSDGQGVWNARIRTDRAAVPWTGTRFEMQTALDTGAGTGSSTIIYGSGGTFTTATDYLICLVSSGTAWTLYVNASTVTLTVSSAGSGGNDGDWWADTNGSGNITLFWCGSGVYLDGKCDDVSYYDDDLTATEIGLLYNSGKPIHPLAVGLTDLSGYWKNGEAENGVASTIYDMKGTDNMTGTNLENADIVTTSYY